VWKPLDTFEQSKEKRMPMKIDPALIDKALNAIPYPVGKSNLVQLAKQHGVNDQVVGLLERLPDKTFNSAQEVKDAMNGLGGMGNIGNVLGGLFK
jgi:hypothetical protein